jgi:hypothetical protein
MDDSKWQLCLDSVDDQTAEVPVFVRESIDQVLLGFVIPNIQSISFRSWTSFVISRKPRRTTTNI